MKMNLPNKLTILRVILIPFFVFFMLVPVTDYDNYIAVAIFIVASLTDAPRWSAWWRRGSWLPGWLS